MTFNNALITIIITHIFEITSLQVNKEKQLIDNFSLFILIFIVLIYDDDCGFGD